MRIYRFDLFTIVALAAISNLIALLLFVPYVRLSKADAYDRAYLLAKIALVLGFALFALEDAVPLCLSYVTANVFLVSGYLLELWAFISIKAVLTRKHLLAGGFALLTVLTLMVTPGLAEGARLLVLNTSLAALYVIAGTLYLRRDPSRSALDRTMGIAFICVSLLHLLRGVFYARDMERFIQESQPMVLIITYVFVTVTSIGYVLLKKEMVDAKAALSDKLMKMDKIKDDFLAHTSHEFRTPLHGIINIAGSMLKDANGAEQVQNLQMIIASGRHLSNLVTDILDYSRLKNSDISLDLTSVDLRKELDKKFLFFRRIKDRLAMINEIGEGIRVRADRGRLDQILFNLISNAVKFTHSGTIRATAKVVESMVEIGIHDTGIGIPVERQKDIFLAFEQGGISGARDYGGYGLGLSVTKSLVDLHGGSIRVESEPGTGSSFYFTLPLCLERPEEEPLPEPLATEIPARAAGEMGYSQETAGDGDLVLLVDDDESNLYATALLLRQAGYAVAAASSGEEALNALRNQQSISLLVLDVMMPDVSGFDLCERIRKSKSCFDLSILMLTARNATSDMVKGMEAGANDYITKPYEAEAFLARVKTLIDLKKAVDQAMASELAFLQAQIKPHFLYNALNTVVSVSRYDGEKARNLIIDLGNYLRRSFDLQGMGQTVPFDHELELVRAYLEIEKARFENMIDVVFNLPEDTRFAVPVLTIQPIVENAVVHGIVPLGEGGRIEINVINDGTVLRISVRDNGVGMDDERCRLVLARGNTRGIGLYNIEKRMRKLYGHGLVIKSKPGQGTEVSLHLPLMRTG